MILGTVRQILIANGMGYVMNTPVTLSVTPIVTVRSIPTAARMAFATNINR